MAKPNYSYEKRQRELAKKQKKEEKLRRKAVGAQPAGDGEAADHETTDAAGPDAAAGEGAPAGEGAAAGNGDGD